MTPRMRTAPGALDIIRQEDPGTDVTLHYLRHLIKTGAIQCVPVGRKKLVNVDKLIDFLKGDQAS